MHNSLSAPPTYCSLLCPLFFLTISLLLTWYFVNTESWFNFTFLLNTKQGRGAWNQYLRRCKCASCFYEKMLMPSSLVLCLLVEIEVITEYFVKSDYAFAKFEKLTVTGQQYKLLIFLKMKRTNAFTCDRAWTQLCSWLWSTNTKPKGIVSSMLFVTLFQFRCI